MDSENFQTSKERKKGFSIKSGLEIILIGLLTALTASIILLSSVPPVSRDELTHHLAIPKLYLKHGGIYEIPEIEFSYYPMNLELLYLIPLFFNNDIVPKFIHFSFALFTAGLIFGYLKKRTDTVYALFGVLLFLSLPVIVKLSITVYVDLGLIFFSAASLLYLLKWIENRFSLRYLLISALWCGLALGTKYNGLIVLFLLTLFVPFVYSRLSQDKSPYKAVRYGTVFFLAALIIFSPWMIRNCIWTGNPLFPLYDNFFNPKSPAEIAEAPARISHFIQRSIFYNESWPEILLIPIRIFFQGQDDSAKYFDGKLNPLLFFLPFFAFFQNKEKSSPLIYEKKILLAFALLFLLFVFIRTDMRIRYISPIIPPLVILSVLGFREICSCLTARYPGKIHTILFSLAICSATGMNAVYIWDQFESVAPLPYIAGKIQRDEYIAKYRTEYPVVRFINRTLPDKAKILCFFLGNRIYYSDREMLSDTEPFRKAVKCGDSPEKIRADLERKGITHFLIRYDLFNKWSADNFDDGHTGKNLQLFFQNQLSLRASEGGYGLFELGKQP